MLITVISWNTIDILKLMIDDDTQLITDDEFNQFDSNQPS